MGYGVDATWVRAAGELDMGTAPELDRVLRDAQSCAHLVVLGMHDVSFIDSAGMHVLISASASARLGGGRLIVDAPPPVHEVFALVGTSDSVDLFDLTADDAARLRRVAS